MRDGERCGEGVGWEFRCDMSARPFIVTGVRVPADSVIFLLHNYLIYEYLYIVI